MQTSPSNSANVSINSQDECASRIPSESEKFFCPSVRGHEAQNSHDTISSHMDMMNEKNNETDITPNDLERYNHSGTVSIRNLGYPVDTEIIQRSSSSPNEMY